MGLIFQATRADSEVKIKSLTIVGISSRQSAAFRQCWHMYRHLGSETYPAHQLLTAIINETHCSICSRTSRRPYDLIKHEKSVHGGRYASRLNKCCAVLKVRLFQQGSSCHRISPSRGLDFSCSAVLSQQKLGVPLAMNRDRCSIYHLFF